MRDDLSSPTSDPRARARASQACYLLFKWQPSTFQTHGERLTPPHFLNDEKGGLRLSPRVFARGGLPVGSFPAVCRRGATARAGFPIRPELTEVEFGASGLQHGDTTDHHRLLWNGYHRYDTYHVPYSGTFLA